MVTNFKKGFSSNYIITSVQIGPFLVMKKSAVCMSYPKKKERSAILQHVKTVGRPTKILRH